MADKPKLLFVTDLAYEANARVYCNEDIYLSSQLNRQFDVALCSPRSAVAFLHDVDVVLFRNTGPIMYFREEYEIFRRAATQARTRVFNELTGKADMQGKQYLIDLYQRGYPVIPSVGDQRDLHRLPDAGRYVEKLMDGADSIGMRVISKTELEGTDLAGKLVQPLMELRYEVSFYYLNDDFQYALYAPNPDQRWSLESYDPTAADLDFAKKFIEWNDIDHGIQRIDACRMPDGELLLMEIEDVNPYLSLDLVSGNVQSDFVEGLSQALMHLIVDK